MMISELSSKAPSLSWASSPASETPSRSHAARLGVRVVLADLSQEPSRALAADLKDHGADVLAVPPNLSGFERWPCNVWVGMSIENRRFVHRAAYLAGCRRRCGSSPLSRCFGRSTVWIWQGRLVSDEPAARGSDSMAR